MSTAVAKAQKNEVARPLKVLVPLIKDELDAGDKAGIEHYRRAGTMLIEAKEQVAHGEWTGWVERNFKSAEGRALSIKTAQYYMRLAETSKNEPRRVFESVRQAVRPDASSRATWHEPVKEIADRVNLNALAQDRQNLEREAKLLRQLAMQLIDIGYRVLAAKLHPDKGGSTEAMARLNKVRQLLKDYI